MELTKLILVDANDTEIGVMEKMEAHQKGLLHRAFSIFIFNTHGEMLLQQRVISKYHSGGLWTNACCSHPCPGEETAAAARRRLREELNLDLPVEKIFEFTYKSEFENGLTEHEFDHVYVAYANESPAFNKEEVQRCRYISIKELSVELEQMPARFTSWFHLAFPKILLWWTQQFPSEGEHNRG